MPLLSNAWQATVSGTERFFYAPASPLPFAVLRIALSMSLLFQWICVFPHLSDLVGSSSLIQESVSKYFYDPGLPKLSQLMRLGVMNGIAESSVVKFLFSVYGISLLVLVLGWKTKLVVWLAFGLNVFFYGSSPTTIYGADEFSRIGLFYLALAPSGDAVSLDNRSWLGTRTVRARFVLRLFQLHLCIAYFASGLEKAVGPQWQSGEVIWRALMLPVYQQYDLSWIAGFPALMKTFAWATLILEIGYPIFVWPRSTRYIWVTAILSLHFGIGFFLGLWFFSFVMCALTFSAFGIGPQLIPFRTTSTLKPPRSETSNLISA